MLKATFIIGYTHILFLKSYGLRQVKVLKLRPIFENFLTVIENYRTNSQVKCSIENADCANFL